MYVVKKQVLMITMSLRENSTHIWVRPLKSVNRDSAINFVLLQCFNKILLH